ncbi:MAG TPA: aminotransferase class IV [Urbifossiella sp.]|nr:aminotransferase class IV [Urbifossiella sp.]
MSLVWVNGSLLDKAAARVSPFDHGFLYGDGVWEPLRVFGGRLFRPDEHFQLLSEAADRISLTLPYTPDELTSATEATVAANRRTEGYCRVIVTRGPGTVGPDPRKLDPQVFITAEEYQPFPSELYTTGLHAESAPYPVPQDPLVWVRVLGQPHVVRAKQHALSRGCLEGIIWDEAGEMLWATEGNICVVRPGSRVVGVAGPWGVGLPNRTMAEVVSAAGYELRVEGKVGLGTLAGADEAFIAGTACGIVGLTRLNGQPIGSGSEGPVTRQVREAYHALTRGADTIPAEGGVP